MFTSLNCHMTCLQLENNHSHRRSHSGSSYETRASTQAHGLAPARLYRVGLLHSDITLLGCNLTIVGLLPTRILVQAVFDNPCSPKTDDPFFTTNFGLPLGRAPHCHKALKTGRTSATATSLRSAQQNTAWYYQLTRRNCQNLLLSALQRH